jgi:CTP:molybdopterin cytidylyltransferase MocA
VIMRPPVPDAQSTRDGLRWVLQQAELEASYVMVVQCTSPFVNPADLTRLFEGWWTGETERIYALSDDGRGPSGMGYIMAPWYVASDLAPIYQLVLQRAPAHDVDTIEDYKRAVEATPAYETYGTEEPR